MAIDAGTGSIRSVIFDIKGDQISVAQKEWEHLEEEGVANSMSFDCHHNWELVCECIKESLSKAGLSGEDIVAVSATSMREGIVLYDADGNELWAVANVDARASDEVTRLKEKDDALEARFYAISGQTFALGALPRLLWLKNNHPEIYEKVASVSMIGDWILARLSGSILSDPSNAGTTGIFSLKERVWQPKMAQEVGIKSDIFPPVLEVGTKVGMVTEEGSKESGLSTKTTVVMGGGDVQLGSAGLGVVEEGQVAVLGGSFWQQVVNIKSDVAPPKEMNIRVNPHVIEGLSQAEGITFFSGLIMRWFRDAFCELEVQEAQRRGVDAYEILEEKAKEVPVGSYGIIPTFSDAMNYKNWYHAAPSFLNLSLDASQCNHISMFRSLEENAAIVSAINLEKIEEFTSLKISEIVFAGGASKGALWSQILADVTGCQVKIPKVTEATALGAAMAAGVGVGVYASLSSAAKELVVWDKTYEPNLEHKKIYDTMKVTFQKAYAVQRQLVDENITTSMWRAPGL